MSTILFDKTIFGPIKSRRLGISLGINLLPNDRKLCSFDCLYCECGFGQRAISTQPTLPTRQEVAEQLQDKLREMTSMGMQPDVITFAGNGEPTLHPCFADIINDVVDLRNRFSPKAKIAVLSNASQLSKPDICKAMALVDDNILKIDAGTEELVKQLDQPQYNYSLAHTVEQVAAAGSNLVVQTMFVRWQLNGKSYDNSQDDSVAAWLENIKTISPPRLMIYTIDRETPLRTMQKIEPARLEQIAQMARQIVPDVQVSY